MLTELFDFLVYILSYQSDTTLPSGKTILDTEWELNKGFIWLPSNVHKWTTPDSVLPLPF